MPVMTVFRLVLVLCCGLTAGVAQAPASAPESDMDTTTPVIIAPASTATFNISLDADECMCDPASIQQCYCRYALQNAENAWCHESLWFVTVTEEELAAAMSSPLMVMSQGLVPEVLWESAAELPRFFPPHWQDVEQQQAADTVGSEDSEDDNFPTDFSSTAQVPSPGSFADVTGWLLSRRQHRIVAPIAPANSPEPYAELGVSNSEIQNQWHLTVANMVSWLTSDTEAVPVSIAQQQYALRAECITALSQADCPIATGNAVDCGARGNCTNTGREENACDCEDGYTGHACNVVAPTISLGGPDDERDGDSQWLRLSDLNNGSRLEVGQWAHLRVKLQSTKVVVVEMNQQAGNCMLIVKPRGQGRAPYDVPSILDFNEFGDVEAYRDHATHAAHWLQQVGDAAGQEISVAVHNFADAAMESVPCEALIRVRTVATGSDQNLCPFDCSDHGSCPGPRASSEFEEDAATATQVQPTWSSIDDAVRCTCTAEEGEEQSQYTGRFCEATLSGVNPRNRIQLDPGEWQAHQFDVKENSLALSIELTLGETIDSEWSEHGNIVFVATRFGRAEDLTAATTPTPTQNDYLFQSGAGSGGLKPFSISAEELADMAVVVFALYNIDQRADASVQYTLKVHSPTTEPLEPELIVAIVIAGVVMLLVGVVLLVVICRQCRARMQDPQVVLQQIGPRVVPPLDPAAIDELETFSFEDLPKKAGTVSARTNTNSERGSKGGNLPNPPMCRICHEDYSPGDQLVKLPCGHIFHKDCCKKWLGEETATCPVCRLNLLDPTAAPLPSRTAGSHTETSFSVPGNWTTPVYTDSAPSVVSSDAMDNEAARRANTNGARMPSQPSEEKSFRSAAATAMYNSTAAGAVAAPNGDSSLSPSRSRSPLYRMFSGPACGTEPSGEGLSQEELFHSMPGEYTVSGVLHSAASASAVAGIPVTAAADGGAGRGIDNCGEGSGDGRALPRGVSAVLGPHMLRDSDVSMVQFPHMHLQHGGEPIVVPPPASPPVVPIVTAPGTLIPAPSGPAPPVPSSPNPSGSPGGVVGTTGPSGAVSVSHSGHSRTVSGIEADFSGLPPIGAGFGASGDLLSPLPGASSPADWAFMGSDRARDQMHEHLLGPVNGRSHYSADFGTGQNAETVAGAGQMMAWRPGQRPAAATDADTLASATAGTALPHAHLHGTTGSDGGVVGGFMPSAVPVTVQLAGNYADADAQRPQRLSDGVGVLSALATRSVQVANGSVQMDRAASEDSLLNSDGGGTVAGDSALDIAHSQFYSPVPSAMNGTVNSPRMLGGPQDQAKG